MENENDNDRMRIDRRGEQRDTVNPSSDGMARLQCREEFYCTVRNLLGRPILDSLEVRPRQNAGMAR